MTAEPNVATPTLIAARWRRELCDSLLTVVRYVSTGAPLVGAPVLQGAESEVVNPYGFVLALIGPDGVVVGTHGLRYAHDAKRAEHAIRDALHPDDLARREAWEAGEQAKRAAYEALSFACERPGYCTARFGSARGRAAHYRAIDRAGCRDWSHRCGIHPCGRPGADMPQPSESSVPTPPRLGIVSLDDR